MTTKQNNMRLGTGVVKPRIVIEFDPVKGGSVLKTYGNLTVPIVIDTLMAQLASLWRQWIQQLQSPVTDASGQPIVKPANTAMPEAEQTPEEEYGETLLDINTHRGGGKVQ